MSAEEVAALRDVAFRHELTSDEVRDLHQELVLGLIDTALDDRRGTKSERADIEMVAEWLGVDVSEWDAMVKAARARVQAEIDDFRTELKGKRIAFTGAGIHKSNIREALAAKHGFEYGTRVTSGVDLLVVGTEQTETGQVAKAHEQGIPIMVKTTFWRRLGEA